MLIRNSSPFCLSADILVIKVNNTKRNFHALIMQLNFAAGVMKTTILLAATLAAALAWKLPPENDAETKTGAYG